MLRLVAFLAVMVMITPSWAEDIKLQSDKQVEYHQKEQKLVAQGNAVASKGDLSIHADTLIGYYAPLAPNKISRVEAHQKVVLVSSQAKAWGDEMVYDVKEDSAVLTGKPARIKTADADITAQGNITFWQSKQQAVAEDNVEATDKQGNKVKADYMTAYFVKDAGGKLVLDRVDIQGNVKINAKDAEITALKGTYHAISGQIELFDDVVITQNGNVLHGDKAETNLNTGISKVLSGPKGRVSGVFKENKKEKSK